MPHDENKNNNAPAVLKKTEHNLKPAPKSGKVLNEVHNTESAHEEENLLDGILGGIEAVWSWFTG